MSDGSLPAIIRVEPVLPQILKAAQAVVDAHDHPRRTVAIHTSFDVRPASNQDHRGSMVSRTTIGDLRIHLREPMLHGRLHDEAGREQRGISYLRAYLAATAESEDVVRAGQRRMQETADAIAVISAAGLLRVDVGCRQPLRVCCETGLPWNPSHALYAPGVPAASRMLVAGITPQIALASLALDPDEDMALTMTIRPFIQEGDRPHSDPGPAAALQALATLGPIGSLLCRETHP